MLTMSQGKLDFWAISVQVVQVRLSNIKWQIISNKATVHCYTYSMCFHMLKRSMNQWTDQSITQSEVEEMTHFVHTM